MFGGLDGSGTTLAAAQKNVLDSSKAMVVRLNDNLKTIYQGKFANWKISVDAGRIDTSNPPQPPMGYGLETDSQGFTFPKENIGGPVCTMPAIPQDRSKPQAPPASMGNGKVMNVPVGDHFPVGFEITSPEGGVWKKMATATPFGTAYYYELVDGKG